VTQAYNLSQLANKVNTSGQVDVATGITGTVPISNGGTGTTSTTYCNLASNVTGTLPVARGGTGATTLTANNVLLGNGTSAVQVVAPGTNGNVLTFQRHDVDFSGEYINFNGSRKRIRRS